MTDSTAPAAALRRADLSEQRLGRRYAAEKRFRFYGLLAIFAALGILGLLIGTIVLNGYTAFVQTHIAVPVYLDPQVIDPQDTNDPQIMGRADYQGLLRTSLRERFPDVSGRRDRLKLYGILSNGAGLDVRDAVLSDPSIIGTTQTLWVKSSDDIDSLVKGYIDRTLPESDRRVKDNEIVWIEALEADGVIETQFNTTFFTAGDSREPEQAGIWGAVVGSFYTLLITLILTFPIGVLSAVYLEEFAPKNKWTDLIEVNINNLAAVPSIIFGLLGLAVFLSIFGLPRSAPLVGGMVLALMTLPTIIIAARAALKAVPPSIREAALGVGASRLQVVTHHVLPLALPGIMTGTIIGMAQALGETAPLLMIGMVAFIVDIPGGVTDPATVLPVQIFLWADAPERAFVEKTNGAIMVLLGFLILMNALAVLLRKRFERQW
ncbi:phosphate ABC transporter permease PstA [Pelagibius sp.]|uniref:phosphate ABC transporter permease PstA n=1 Tax=Pelagibius sp. TaxID=1931238 RepID=UPI003B500C8B